MTSRHGVEVLPAAREVRGLRPLDVICQARRPAVSSGGYKERGSAWPDLEARMLTDEELQRELGRP